VQHCGRRPKGQWARQRITRLIADATVASRRLGVSPESFLDLCDVAWDVASSHALNEKDWQRVQ
jgi:hypothetical protein